MDSHLITHFHVIILVAHNYLTCQIIKNQPRCIWEENVRHFENRMTKFVDLKIWDQNRMRQNRELKLHLSVIKPLLHLN
jgi:hypothetical protein